ncbi:MAG: phosphodiester glycosidase family protein [Cyanobacteria bacterium P01_A01_bin.114]
MPAAQQTFQPTKPNGKGALWQALWAGLLAIPLLGYGGLHFRRPPLDPAAQTLFQGVAYQRTVHTTPRPHVIHTVAIDLQSPGIGILVTPGAPGDDNREVHASTTTDFIQTADVQLAINANYFAQFEEDTPWRYAPRSGERVDVIGTAISNSQQYSRDQPKWAVLCFSPDRLAQIVKTGTCPRGTDQAVAGKAILVDGGASAIREKTQGKDKPYARVAVGLNADGTQLWIVVVDGKQLMYSEGLTEAELAEVFLDLGAEIALNLDGGGSTTLAIATPTGPKLLNAPIHTKLPMRERPVANHLGIYAKPQP